MCHQMIFANCIVCFPDVSYLHILSRYTTASLNVFISHFGIWTFQQYYVLVIYQFDTGICILAFPYIYPHTHHYGNNCHNMAWSTPMCTNPMTPALLCRCSRRNSWQNKETWTAGKYTVNAHILDGYIKHNIILETRYTQLFRPVGSLTQVKILEKEK